ncbi:MAG: phage tail assembly protein [Planctomycetota bacterium]
MSDEETEKDDLEVMLEGWVTDHVGGTSTLKLEVPIGTEERPLRELKVARPRAKHIRHYDDAKPPLDQVLRIAEDLTELSRNQIDALDVADAMRLAALIGRDFASGLGGISGAR